LKQSYEEKFNQKRQELENFIGDRLVSLTIYSVAHNAADALDRIIEERRRIMMKVNQAFGFKKETPA
jgi:hypothetical protein